MKLMNTRVAMFGVAAATAALAAACGGGSSGGGSQAVSAGSGGGSVLGTQSTSIGSVTTAAANGHTVYVLQGDSASNPMCTAACEKVWPPVMSGGTIMVLHGRPLFTFTGDSGAGQTNGQKAKDTWGTWLAVSSVGQPITGSVAPPAPANTSSSSGGSGGYGY
jgi:predicted lipoprotein with Yx(FWY)xxD motif